MGTEIDLEKEKLTKTIDEVIYPEIEPGIINKQMIEKAYLLDEHKGEAGRLQQMEPVVYQRITELRLEFRNILRIDHLWILPNLTKLSLNCNKIEEIEHIDMLVNLKELDLSFNYIEKIENLEKLEKLEVLALFNNRIKKIENLECLENLIILSIGNNLIETVEGIERFRFMKKLQVLNLEGNPVSRQPDFSLALYIAAILPDLKYYEYVLIKDEVRTEAKEKFYRELREIEANQEMELTDREQKAKEEQDAERLSSSFVEHLNGHQLYQSLWIGDDDGHALMTVGSAAQTLAEEYDNDMFEITQEIYKLGLERYEEREIEIKEFMENLEEGQLEVQKIGQKIIEDFLLFKDNIFEEATECLKALELRTMRGEDEESPLSIQYADQFERISMQFDETINDTWQQLMSQELHLHESVEETITNFQRKMQELMAKFVEQAQSMFALLRDIALHFSENISDIVSRFIGENLALQDFDSVPQELKLCMEDREAISNLVAGMKEMHTLRIDEREDRLMMRSREFIEKMIEKLTNDELERNRRKILEINSFLELMSDNLANLQNEIREELMNEEN